MNFLIQNGFCYSSLTTDVFLCCLVHIHHQCMLGNVWYTFCCSVRPAGTSIDGSLPKGPYPPCLRMAARALLAGCHRYDITTAWTDRVNVEYAMRDELQTAGGAYHWTLYCCITTYTAKKHSFRYRSKSISMPSPKEKVSYHWKYQCIHNLRHYKWTL